MNGSPRILVVEDEEIIRKSLCEFLTEEGFEVAPANSVESARKLFRDHETNELAFDVAICDVQLPDGDGIELLSELIDHHPDTAGLVITAYATVDNAVKAFGAGAFDYLVKPVIFEDLAHKLRRLFQYQAVNNENRALRRELQRRDDSVEIIGSSESLGQLQSTILKVAETNSNVLLVGETGTGKELFARAIHRAGPQAESRFLAVHCSTRPTELLESQLFGTGTKEPEPGVFQQVGPGTVFLDEIAKLPLSTQSRLLQAIEYREILPVGGSDPQTVEARIIASTCRNLAREVDAGTFQEDLFYRLDGVKLQIPPLRERLEDVPELVTFFITRHARAMGKRVTGATEETVRLLMSAQWQGNVRQLDNAIERAVMLCDGETIVPTDLPPELLGLGQPLPDTDDRRSALRHYERLHIARVLRQCPDKREAAKRLRLGLSSLYRKIEELDISP
ncbi:MAG: sigma-54 dependent transcriptional regulator [Planctomycetota bacterium]|nr:sigma-54 dependent transcriptional regulator [Planctomycetota bacterium]